MHKRGWLVRPANFSARAQAGRWARAMTGGVAAPGTRRPENPSQVRACIERMNAGSVGVVARLAGGRSASRGNTRSPRAGDVTRRLPLHLASAVAESVQSFLVQVALMRVAAIRHASNDARVSARRAQTRNGRSEGRPHSMFGRPVTFMRPVL